MLLVVQDIIRRSLAIVALTLPLLGTNRERLSLSFVDRPGAEMLRQLLRQGVRIHACSPFVAELLHWDHNPNP